MDQNIEGCESNEISNLTKLNSLYDPFEIYIQDTHPELYRNGWHKIWNQYTGLFYWWNHITGKQQFGKPWIPWEFMFPEG